MAKVFTPEELNDIIRRMTNGETLTPEEQAAVGVGVSASGFDSILKVAKEKYGYIDILFQTNPELVKFLTKAVKENWSPTEFQTRLTNTQWFISNGTTISARIFSKNQYLSLIKGIDPNDKDAIKKATANTDYARGLDTTMAELETTLTSKGISYTPEQLSTWASELYDTANEKNRGYIARWVNTKIGFGTSTKGTGATNMADLTSYAQDQGLDITRDFGQSDVGGWLQRLDKGESLDAIKKEIDVRAAIGESESVQALMKQGLSRKTIYSSLVNRYNTKLDRSDLTMNDVWFQKNSKDEKGNLLSGYQLDAKVKADKSLGWEFTTEAREEYGDYAFNILKDFGLTGGR
jgi:hypothetical protein